MSAYAHPRLEVDSACSGEAYPVRADDYPAITSHRDLQFEDKEDWVS